MVISQSVRKFWVLALFAGLIVLPPVHSFADYSPVERVSVDAGDGNSDGASNLSRISASDDGRYVAFESAATDLVAGDDNGVVDVFLRDRTSGTTVRVSLSDSDQESQFASMDPDVSSDGNLVVFESSADDLISGDTNDVSDIFVRNISAGTTTRVSVKSGGFQVNGASRNPVISADGRYVAFESDADDLVAGDLNQSTDVFVYDLQTSTITRVSVGPGGVEADGNSRNPAISDDGDIIAFESDATDLVSGDENGETDVFFHDQSASTTTRASVRSGTTSDADGSSSNPAVSGDGAVIGFESAATDLVSEDENGAIDVFVYSLSAGTVTRVSVNTGDGNSNGASSAASISEDGRFVAFQSVATDLVAGDDNAMSDVFVRDVTGGNTARVSVRATGQEVDGTSQAASINGNANFVAYSSDATDLLAGDDNQAQDIFVINTQCLLSPPGVTALDTDGDGTDDCSDDCALDAGKTSAGTCGCGVADTDSDGDGTADCIDECASDSRKTSGGSCGCGTADTDSNGNGIADCLDPGRGTVPDRPAVIARRNGRVTVVIPSEFPGVRYLVQIRSENEVLRTLRRGRQIFKIARLPRGARLVLRYRIILPGGGFSRFSRRVRFRTR